MKVSDYIVEYIIQLGITDIFGYPGGMITHLMDSLGKREDRISTHITYHEQAAAFAACGYAQASDRVGVAFATSGPGATNLITGIGNAYFDSIPTVFITGQVNTFESKGILGIRQRGFQETNIVPMVSEITKAAFYVKSAEEIPEILYEAFRIAMEDRKGPVLIDIPMDILRTDIVVNEPEHRCGEDLSQWSVISADFSECLNNAIKVARRPCLVLGNGLKIDHQINNIRGILRTCPIPVVSSMLAVDIIPEGQGLEGIYYGFIGAYGNRTANFVVAKSDLLICLGTRLDVRQVGGKREQFASNAKIIRIDIDGAELNHKIRNEECSFCLPLKEAIPILRRILAVCPSYNAWLEVCQSIKKQIKYIDEKEPNRFINAVSRHTPDGYSIVADVGQHMVWVAQSFRMKPDQRVYFSGGMGAMGYALPASIGIYYATRRPVVCFVGDGGIQMNIQEFQFLAREQLPIKIIILNNCALGMIRHFQEMYFNAAYYYTVQEKSCGGGYTTPDFVKVAEAYGIKGNKVRDIGGVEAMQLETNEPQVFEIIFSGNTYVFPKLEFGKPNQDQEPLLDRALYNYLMGL